VKLSREQFELHFTDYRKHLRDEVHRFRDSVDVYKLIQERKVDQLQAINLAPAFFGVVESSLFTTIVLWADKLFDEKGERGFFNFLNFVEYNRKWLQINELKRRRNYPDGHWMLQGRIPVTAESINRDREKIRALPVLTSFRIRRDKFHGHFDKDYFFDRNRLEVEAPVRWKDLAEAGEVMGALINDYSVDFDGSSFSWETINIDDLGQLLRVAERGIKKTS
jgi:AbiU2